MEISKIKVGNYNFKVEKIYLKFEHIALKLENPKVGNFKIEVGNSNFIKWEMER